VGLASYLLIGFWFKKPSANAAAIKAFVVNRVGDLRLHARHLRHLPGVRHHVDPRDPRRRAGHGAGDHRLPRHALDTMTILCLLLFIGAMGKSAQLGLHTWLPDAMEGPTPVSALIHAATMVTAGVFMVCRLSPMFEASADALGSSP
jgi:NADH-quinone oxidoreductase subunit L